MKYLIAGLVLVLVFLSSKAEARNDYLNSYPQECRTGEVDVSISQRDYDYNDYNNSHSRSDTEEVRLTFRKYLGKLQCTERNELRLENEKLRQQLELMKMCTKFNRNPSLQNNPNFALLASKCTGVQISLDDDIQMPKGSLWDELKEDWEDKNPGKNIMNSTKEESTLKMPEDLTGPLPIPE
tara:strand:- start:115 stop:660 length:546 start_codon:yes stop_codon:yes gene_type:complete